MEAAHRRLLAVYFLHRRVLKDADLVFQLVASLGRQAKPVKPAIKDAIIQAGHAGKADAPLGTQRSEYLERLLVLGPYFDWRRLYVFGCEPERLQFLRIWRPAVERRPQRDQFPSRALTISSMYAVKMARAAPT